MERSGIGCSWMQKYRGCKVQAKKLNSEKGPTWQVYHFKEVIKN